MTIHLGNVPAGTTLYVPFHTFDSSGASVTISNFAVGDIGIYKNGSTTQRSSTNGFTLLDTDGIDFDSLTGIHGFSVDLSDNTDAGFYAVGSFYWIVVGPITANTQTVQFVAATFRIVTAENTSGLPVIDVAKINNVSTSSVTTVNANVGTTQPVNFTGTGGSALVKTDMVDIAGAAVSTTTAQLGVNAVKINNVATTSVTTINANVGTTDVVNFTGTGASALVKTDMVDVAGAAVSTSSAQIGVNVIQAAGTAWGSGAITAASIAADAITAAKVADGTIDAATFAAGAINAAAIASDAITAAKIADGAIDAATFAAGAIDATAIAADAIGSSELAASAANEIADAVLARNVSGGSSAGRTVSQALHFLRNKWTISAGTLTVYDTDDTTSSWTATVGTDNTAEPIVSNDPA